MFKNKDPKQFKKEFDESAHGEYTLIDEYERSNKKVHVHHNRKECKCPDFWIRPNDWLNGIRCPSCSKERVGKNRRSSSLEFRRKFEAVTNGEYILLTEYETRHKKVHIKHNCEKCGNYDFWMTPGCWLQGYRCPKCGKMLRAERSGKGHLKSPEKFKEEFELSAKEEYILESEYTKKTEKIKIHHNICGKSFYMTAGNWIIGHRCPYCASSHGEKIIDDFLKERNINAKSQYRFPDCKDKRSLIFDFVILKGDKPIAAIEFDGIQHFMPIFGGKNKIEKFKMTQYHDKLKDEYCAKHNIPLLRISDEHDNISKNDILDMLRDFIKNEGIS